VLSCRVGLLPLSEFTVMIPEQHATLQDEVTWRNQCHNRATLQGVRILCAILEIVFSPYFIFFIFCFLNAVWDFTSGGFPIVSDTLVHITLTHHTIQLALLRIEFCLTLFGEKNKRTA